MFLKQTFAFVLAMSMLLLSSCTFPPEHVSKRANKKKIQSVMEMIKNEEKDEIIQGFSIKLQDSHAKALNEEIDMMYACLDGKIVSYDEPIHCGYSQEKVNYGDITLYVSSPDVRNVKTENGQLFTFLFTYTPVDDENPENIGIEQIKIFTQNEDESLGEMLLNINGNASD